MSNNEYNFELNKSNENMQRRQRLFWGRVAFVLLLITFLFAMLFKSYSADSTLIGRWSIDDITLYEFCENGKGAMILPSETYEFSYTVEGDKISIDFESEFATDKKYTYEIKGNKLTLIGEGKFGGVYKMTKMNDK